MPRAASGPTAATSSSSTAARRSPGTAPSAGAPAPDSNTPHSGPRYPRANYDGATPPFATEPRDIGEEPSFAESRTPAVIVDESLTIPDPVPPAPLSPKPTATPSRPIIPQRAATPEGQKLVVPVGEFDSGVKTINDGDEGKIRAMARSQAQAQAQATIKRDPAEALLKIGGEEIEVDADELLEEEPAADTSRGDPTAIDSQTAKFDRSDPTPDHDATGAPRAKHLTGGTLRASAALRRKRGLLGDARYVITVVFGVRSSRRELAELEHRQELRQTSRRRHLVTLGRTAIITDTFDHGAMAEARDQLSAIEDERSKHVGAVSAADAELDRVRRDRESKAKQYKESVAATEKELAELSKKLDPLEKEAATARKRAQELRESLRRIDKQIADTEALFTSVKGEKMDKAAIEADLATHKADRKAVLRDEPVIAASLDALEPRIAAIEGSRTELRKKRVELDRHETEDQRRTMELLDAIAAKRKVVDRASADAEAARDKALYELGDRLYVDRPKSLGPQLAPIDQIDLELGEGDRRIMELREILMNVDKAKLARGLALIILVGGAVGLFLFWVLSKVL